MVKSPGSQPGYRWFESNSRNQPKGFVDHQYLKEVITETAVTVASLLTDAATVIPQGVGVAWEIITSNPLLIFFAGASIVSMGFGYWRKAKRAAR